MATRLAERGLTVVSGLAAGVDTAAHQAALRAGGRTVAVIGTGIRRHFPPENRDLHREVAERGAMLSPEPRRSPSWSSRAASVRTIQGSPVEASLRQVLADREYSVDICPVTGGECRQPGPPHR
ncbi:DNA-processing protein DprA [Nonomuraea sp. NPDC048892]|uniref:DNA-processing protein DprA n=1 Tax=Nonomuraea sp. NPDC048892 TaxID=3154624 RepID=UPI0033F69C45